MKAFLIDRYGKHQGRLAEVPDPEPGIHDVLVKVHASSVNQLDSKISKGEFKLILPYTFPLIMGNDLAGVVVRVGSGVRTFKPGDEVYARPPDARIGGFAELIAIKESALALKPKNTSMEQAAALPLVALTAWQVLVETARVKKGQKVFIQAGSGGVGSIAIQLAKHLGAFVATTTSTANVEWVKALGADVVIDYTQQNVENVLRDYDVVLNSLGPAELEKIPAHSQAGWAAHLHLGATDRRVRTRAKAVLGTGLDHAPVKQRHTQKKPAGRASTTGSCSCARAVRNCSKSPRSSSPALSHR